MDGPFLALLVDLDYLVKKGLLQMGQVCHSYQIGYLAFLVGQELVKVEKLLCLGGLKFSNFEPADNEFLDS